MEDILKSVLRNIFDVDDMDCNDLNRLVVAVKACGIRKEEQLKWLQEDDVKHILPPVQVRMLLNHVKLKYSTATSGGVSNPNLQSVEQQVVSVNLKQQHITSVESRASVSHPLASMQTHSTDVSPSAIKSWTENFTIPWAKCPDSFIACIDAGKAPPARDLHQLITHTMSDIMLFTRHASRENLRIIARKIVRRSPNAFADYINGKAVGDGVQSIMLMLESRKENLNRKTNMPASKSPVTNVSQPNTTGQLENKTPKKSSTGKTKAISLFGCQHFEPALADGVSYDMLELKRKEWCSMFNNGSIFRDSLEVDRLMESTFCLQRRCINDKTPVGDVIEKWPFLGTVKSLLQHFRLLTGIDLESSVRSALGGKVETIYEFFCSGMAFSTNLQLSMMIQLARQKMEVSGNKQPLMNCFLLMMMAYFREDSSNLVRFDEVCCAGYLLSELFSNTV